MANTFPIVSFGGYADPLDPELWGAEDSGYLGWTQDPQYTNSTVTVTSHVYFLQGLRVRRGGSCGHVVFQKGGTAGTITDWRFGLYNASGTQLTKTTNQSANVTGTAVLKSLAWPSAVVLPPGKYWVVMWSIASPAGVVNSSTASAGPSTVAQNDPTGSTAIRRFGSVSDGGSGTDVPASLTVSSGAVTSPAFTVTATQQMPWIGLAA